MSVVLQERVTHYRGRDGAGAIAHESSGTRVTAWPLWAVLSLFWLYVTLSNVLYAAGMSVALDPGGINHYFAAWDVRVVQHLSLYPVLLGTIWLSLRVGWRPAWRTVPLQLSLGIAFAALAAPFLYIADMLIEIHTKAMGGGAAHGHGSVSATLVLLASKDRSLWIATTTSFLLTYGFALALATGLALYQRYRDSELRLAALERAWSGARLAALRMQLSPHTLFNLLHTIRGQIGWDPAAAQSMVVQLGDLLRRLLAAGEHEFCQLAEEMQFVRLYLELQRQRFADRLQLSLPDAAQMPAVWVPSLILQPLVENAVVHGLAGHAGAVTLRLDVSVSDDSLVLTVSNTTAGQASSRDGIGLCNVRERLAVHFGERAVLRAGPSAAHEWRAAIQMPLLYERR
jgi:hypothetical protein